MDYRGLPQEQGDPNNELPAYNGFNPLLRGVHQNMQWGTPDVNYPNAPPPVYDTTGPPLSFPPKKIRPIRPYPAPGVEVMPDLYDLPNYLPACPKNNSKCNRRKTPEEIRREGSVGNPNTNVATTDSSVESASATVDSSTGTTATTDGTSTTVPAAGTTMAPTDGTAAASTDGTAVASTDTTVASTDGTSVASTDGTTVPSAYGNTVAPTDGTGAPADTTAAPTDGITTPTDTTVATLPSTAQVVPSDDTLVGKKFRRSILHPRDFRVQMR